MKTETITENRIQQECYMWLHNTYPELRGLYFEIHNNAHSAKSGMIHKAIGRQPGVADNCLLLPNGQGPVFLEFKTGSGKQSEAQKKWEAICKSAGYKYYVIRSLNDFKSLCLQLGLR